MMAGHGLLDRLVLAVKLVANGRPDKVGTIRIEPLLHEEVEKTLIDQLNLHYLHAHQIATRAEEAAVRAAGVGWREYDRFMQKYVKRIGDERLTKVPADLDLKPYRDEHDYDLVQRMLACIARGQAPLGIKAKDVERAVGRYMPHVRDFKAKAKCKRRGLVR